MNKRVLVSLHDVTPFHLERIRKAEDYFRRWGVSKCCYLFIPDYHRKNALLPENQVKEFRAWVEEKKDFQVEWALHGYYHLENIAPGADSQAPQERLSAGEQWKQKHLTAGEAEFLPLSSTEITQRLKQGILVFEEFLGFKPDIFVAPAWLFNRRLLACLHEQGISVTEDHRRIYFPGQEKSLPAPVITWATRTVRKRWTSRLGCPLLCRLWSGKPLLRIAIHPYDFYHPGTIKSIEKVLTRALSERQSLLCKELIA